MCSSKSSAYGGQAVKKIVVNEALELICDEYLGVFDVACDKVLCVVNDNVWAISRCRPYMETGYLT